MKTQIPIYRAKKIDSDEYVIGYHLKDNNGNDVISEVYMPSKGCRHIGTINIDSRTHSELFIPSCEEIDLSTLAIQMPERDFFMSLNAETGKGGDKISEESVLVWNGDMMNCSVLYLYPDGSINDYEISLDNSDFDRFEAIGIQE